MEINEKPMEINENPMETNGKPWTSLFLLGPEIIENFNKIDVSQPPEGVRRCSWARGPSQIHVRGARTIAGGIGKVQTHFFWPEKN